MLHLNEHARNRTAESNRGLTDSVNNVWRPRAWELRGLNSDADGIDRNSCENSRDALHSAMRANRRERRRSTCHIMATTFSTTFALSSMKSAAPGKCYRPIRQHRRLPTLPQCSAPPPLTELRQRSQRTSHCSLPPLIFSCKQFIVWLVS